MDFSPQNIVYSVDWSYLATLQEFYRTEQGCDTRIIAFTLISSKIQYYIYLD
nr:MAG TPA: hypothetical protein [Caudoviricetes sp.]